MTPLDIFNKAYERIKSQMNELTNPKLQCVMSSQENICFLIDPVTKNHCGFIRPHNKRLLYGKDMDSVMGWQFCNLSNVQRNLNKALTAFLGERVTQCQAEMQQFDKIMRERYGARQSIQANIQGFFANTQAPQSEGRADQEFMQASNSRGNSNSE